MQAPRLNSAADFARFWRARCAVAADGRLRGEAKLAWQFLFFQAEMRETTIITSPAAIAADQGRDSRSGLRCLEALEAAGYLEVIDRRGAWTVFLCDATRAAIARPGPRSHGQGELFEVDIEEQADEATILSAHEGRDTSTTSSRPAVVGFPTPPPAGAARSHSADVVPHPPRPLHLENKNSIETSHFNLNLKGEGSRKGGGGSGATSAGEPRSIGELVGLRDFLGENLDAAAKVQQLKAWILEQAADPALHPKKAEDLAERVVAGDWPLNELAAVLEITRRTWRETLAGRAKDPIRNRTHYLLGAARRSIERHDRSTR